MTTVQLESIGSAVLNGRRWSSASVDLQQMLQSSTDLLFIHGGIPDVEEFIVAELTKHVPLVVTAKVAEPEDPDAVEATGPPDEETVY